MVINGKIEAIRRRRSVINQMLRIVLSYARCKFGLLPSGGSFFFFGVVEVVWFGAWEMLERG